MMMNRMNTNAIRTQRVEEIMSREPLALSPMMRRPWPGCARWGCPVTLWPTAMWWTGSSICWAW